MDSVPACNQDNDQVFNLERVLELEQVDVQVHVQEELTLGVPVLEIDLVRSLEVGQGDHHSVLQLPVAERVQGLETDRQRCLDWEVAERAQGLEIVLVLGTVLVLETVRIVHQNARVLMTEKVVSMTV